MPTRALVRRPRLLIPADVSRFAHDIAVPIDCGLCVPRVESGRPENERQAWRSRGLFVLRKNSIHAKSSNHIALLIEYFWTPIQWCPIQCAISIMRKRGFGDSGTSSACHESDEPSPQLASREPINVRYRTWCPNHAADGDDAIMRPLLGSEAARRHRAD